MQKLVNVSCVEVCKHDGVMSNTFMSISNRNGAKVYFVCEYSGMHIKLSKPEYRNGVKYFVEVK